MSRPRICAVQLRGTTVRILWRRKPPFWAPSGHGSGSINWHRTPWLIFICTHDSPAEQRDTLLHELFHAIIHAERLRFGFDGQDEEVVVRRLTAGFMDLLERNPDLIAHLI